MGSRPVCGNSHWPASIFCWMHWSSETMRLPAKLISASTEPNNSVCTFCNSMAHDGLNIIQCTQCRDQLIGDVYMRRGRRWVLIILSVERSTEIRFCLRVMCPLMCSLPCRASAKRDSAATGQAMHFPCPSGLAKTKQTQKVTRAPSKPRLNHP